MTNDFGGIWRRLLVFIDILAVLSGCIAVVLLYVSPGVYGTYDSEAMELRVLVYGSPTFDFVVIGCVALLAANILVWVYGRRPATKPLYHLPSDTPSGPVRIERGALETGLRAATEDLDLITRARIGVDQDGPKRYVVRAFFQCPAGVTILEASEELRKALADRFEAMVRLPDGSQVGYEIEFVGFSGRPAKKADAGAEAPEPEPFRGPQYPIEGEDFEELPSR